MADLKEISRLQESYAKTKENYVRLKTQLESLETRKAQIVESLKAEGVDPDKLDERITELEKLIKEEADRIQGLLAKVAR